MSEAPAGGESVVQTLVAAIEADTRGRDEFVGATRDMAQAARDLQVEVRRAGSAIAALKNPVMQFRSIIMGLAGGFSLNLVIREVVAFETAMSKLTVAGELTAVQMDAVRANIKGLAASTNNSATEIATGMTALVKAGFTATEAVRNIAPAMDLADATATDLAATATILARTLQAFGRTAADSAQVADILAVAAKKSGAGLQEIGHALKLTAPVARGYGVSLEETAVALGMMSKASGSAMRSQMALQQLMSLAGKDAENMRAKLKAWGMSAESLREALARPDGLVEVVKKLRDAGVSAAEMQEVLGARAVGIIMPLIQQADAFEKNVKAAKNATGAAAEYARVMNDNIKGDAKTAQAALTALALEIGDSGLGGALRAGLQALTGFVRGLMGVVTEVQNASATMRFFNTIGRMVASNFELLADAVTTFGLVWSALVVRNIAAGAGAFTGLTGIIRDSGAAFRELRSLYVEQSLNLGRVAGSVGVASKAMQGLESAAINVTAGAITMGATLNRVVVTVFGTWWPVLVAVAAAVLTLSTRMTGLNETLAQTRARVANAAIEFDRLGAMGRKLAIEKDVEVLQDYVDKLEQAKGRYRSFKAATTLGEQVEATVRYGTAWERVVAILGSGSMNLRDYSTELKTSEKVNTENAAAVEEVSEQFKQQLLIVERNTAAIQLITAKRRQDGAAIDYWTKKLKEAQDGLTAFDAAAAAKAAEEDRIESVTTRRIQSLVNIIEKGNPLLAAARQRQMIEDDFASLGKLSEQDIAEVTSRLSEYGYTLEQVKASMSRLKEVWALERREASEAADIYKRYRDELAQVRGSLSPIIGIERQREDGLKQLTKLAAILGVEHSELVYWQDQLNQKYDDELKKIYGLLGPLDLLARAFERIKVNKEAVAKTDLGVSTLARDPALTRALNRLGAGATAEPVRVTVKADTSEAAETVQTFARELNTSLKDPATIRIGAMSAPAVDAIMVVESRLSDLPKTYQIDIEAGASIAEIGRALTEAGIPAQQLSGYLDELAMRIDFTDDAFTEFFANTLPAVGGTLVGLVRQYNETEMAIEDLEKSKDQLTTTLVLYKAAQQSTSDEARALIKVLDDMGLGEDALTRSIDGTTLALARQNAQLEFNESALGKILQKYAEAESLDVGSTIRRQFDPGGESVRELQTELNKAREILKAIENSAEGSLDGLTAPAVRRRIEELEKQLRSANRQLRLGGGEAAKAVEAAWERAAENINDAFLNLFKSLFRGVDDFKDALVETFKTTVAQIAATALNETIVMPIVVKIKDIVADKIGDFLGGVFGRNGAAGGSGGVFGAVGEAFGGAVRQFGRVLNGGPGAQAAAGGSLAGTLVSVGTTFSKLAGSMLAFGKAYLATFTTAGATVTGTIGGATAAGGLGAGAAVAAAYATPALIGYGVGDYFGTRFGGQRGNINAGMAIGGAAGGFAGGAALGAKLGSWAGPIGIGIGMAVGAIAGGLVGGNKTTIGSGVQLAYSGDDGLTGQSYYIEKTRKNFGKSDKRVFRYSDLDPDYAASIKDSLDIPLDQIRNVAEALGVSAKAIDDFVVASTVIDLNGLNEEQAAEKIGKWLESVTVSAIEKFLTTTEGVPERLKQTMDRFKTGDETVGAFLEDSRYKTFISGLGKKTGDYLRSIADKSVSEAIEIVNTWQPSKDRDYLRMFLESFLTRTREGWTEEYIKAFETFSLLESLIATDPLETVQKSRADAARTGTQVYADLVDVMLEAVDEFDGSIETGQELASAFYAVREAQITLIAQLYETRDAMLGLFSDTQQSIRESLMTPEQLYGYRTARVNEIASELQDETDPGRIAALSTEANDIIRRLYESLEDDQRQAMAGGFLATLEDLKALVERQTQSGIDAIDSESTALNERVTAEMLAAADRQGQAVDDFGEHVDRFGEATGMLGRILDNLLARSESPISNWGRRQSPAPVSRELGY